MGSIDNNSHERDNASRSKWNTKEKSVKGGHKESVEGQAEERAHAILVVTPMGDQRVVKVVAGKN